MKLAAVLPAALLAAPGVSAAVMYPMAFSDPTTPALKERSACVGPLLAYLKANGEYIVVQREAQGWLLTSGFVMAKKPSLPT